MSKLRSKAPAAEESKFQRLIRRGGATAKTKSPTSQRAVVLLRLDPDLLAQLDNLAWDKRLKRHSLIVSILEKAVAA